MSKFKYNFLEIVGLFYCFAITFASSTGDIIVKIARILLIFSFLIYILKVKKIKLDITFYEKWCFVFCGFSIFSLVWSISKNNTILALSSLSYIIICNIVMIYILKSNPNYVYSILKINIIGALMHGFTLYTKYGFNVYFNTRGGSNVENANTIGFISCVTIIFCFILLIKNKIKYKSLYFCISIILLLFALLSASRKIFIYLLVFFLAYYIFHSRNSLKKFRRIFISILIILVIYYFILNIPFLYEIIGVRIESAISGIFGNQTDGSTSFRLQLITWGIEWFKNRPFLGYGIDCYKFLLGTSYDTWAGSNGVYAHNNYIELLVNIGIIGTLIYYSLYLRIVSRYFKNKNKSNLIAFSLILSIMIAEYGQVTYSNAFFQQVILILFFLTYNQKNKRERSIV